MAKPKVANQQKTIIIGGKQESAKKDKQYLPSDRRLKVRNFDDKTCTNEDLKKLFEGIGPLKICRFDRDNFG